MHFVTQCTCVFAMVLKMNSDYYSEQQSMAYLYTYHGETVKQRLKGITGLCHLDECRLRSVSGGSFVTSHLGYINKIRLIKVLT